jgi:hypothetical protein
MKIAIFICDNRPLDSNKDTCQYNSLVAYINAIYSAGHKYSFYYFKPFGNDVLYVAKDPNTGEQRHASWAKLLSATLLLNTNTYDYVVCIDSDCVFKNIHTRLESLIESHPEKDFIVANNSPYHPHLPCCAFFICKNTEWTRGFLKDWYMYANPSSDSAEWKHVIEVANQTYKIHFTLGTYWEQDTLWLLMQDPEISSHIHIFEESIMFAESATQYLIHISHERNDIRKRYFLEYTEHLENQTKQSFQTILSILPVIEFDAADFTFKS